MNKFHFYLEKVTKNKKLNIFNERSNVNNIIKKLLSLYVREDKKHNDVKDKINKIFYGFNEKQIITQLLIVEISGPSGETSGMQHETEFENFLKNNENEINNISYTASHLESIKKLKDDFISLKEKMKKEKPLSNAEKDAAILATGFAKNKKS